jgi:extracellular elastinolytic metalloproteinase
VAGSGVAVVFFDLGDTLGTAVVGGRPPRLVGFDVFPFAPALLADLRARGLRLGLISNTGSETGDAVNAVLRPTGILATLDGALLLYSGDLGITKTDPEIFRQAAARAGLGATPARCLFVGEDTQERVVAASAGLRVCPHPLLVGEVLDGQALRFVRVTAPAAPGSGDWREELRRRPFVPQRFAGPGGTVIHGLTSQRVALELIGLRFAVELLGEPDLPLSTDLYLLRDDAGRRSGLAAAPAARTLAAAAADRLIVAATPEGVIAALPPDPERGLDRVHFEAVRHGHTVKLTPDPHLWATPRPTAPPAAFAALEAPVIPDDAVARFGAIDPAEILDIVQRYSGATPLGGPGSPSVASRHIRHPDNPRAVDQIVADLEAAGRGHLQVRLHRFTHAGRELHNVEAELAGGGPELVLVTAHLDSTAASQSPYDPAADPAPGADDDASGVATVLAIARRFADAAAQGIRPGRTVRFVLFNAEEQGLVGSAASARRSKARQERIAAVWQIDMIGFNNRAPRDWEVHAGFEPSPAVEARSRHLAELLRDVASVATPALPSPQIHHSQSLPEGDPAAGRSDHASFQAQGYPAVVVSEDFFLDDGPDPAEPDANPSYHTPGDRVIDEAYTADIARAIGVAAWVAAFPLAPPPALERVRFTKEEIPMAASRELDSRKRSAAASPAGFVAPPSPSRSRTNALTGSPAVVAAAGAASTDRSLVDRAMTFVQRQSSGFGVTAGQVAEFVPDPVVQRTSSGSAAVNLVQTYRGLTVFQMSRTVRFDPVGRAVDAAGDTAGIPEGVSTEPVLPVEAAVLKAARHLASTGAGDRVRDSFGQETAMPAITVTDFKPTVVSGFPLPARPSVLDKGPFENLIPAYLLIFNQPGQARLAWHVVLTLPGYADQYVLIVAADDPNGEMLYCKSTMRRVLARGRVFEFSPGIAERRLIEFPRPLADYPVMPAAPISGFPIDWVSTDEAIGNSTRATLNFSPSTLGGAVQNGVVVFDPADPEGDDQKLLNIFYFCSYMHDFLFILGFDEASGNFQQVNFTNTGSGGDPVRARAHSGRVQGTANMATGPDGLPPVMNMGLVSGPRHTAFDADVVYHEFVHGLTNRLVGGRLNAHALDKLQSGGMGEGWSDYFALTVQNFFRAAEKEKVVTGDWVVADPGGIRRAPYDDGYPFKYGDLAASPEVHDIGEVWCAALMMMTRKLRAALVNDQQGYRLAWQMVVDGLKLTPANPTFLDARDAILQALGDLGATNRVPPATVALARRAAWEAFAHFGMGANAFSGDADSVDDITADFSLPPGV